VNVTQLLARMTWQGAPLVVFERKIGCEIYPSDRPRTWIGPDYHPWYRCVSSTYTVDYLQKTYVCSASSCVVGWGGGQFIPYEYIHCGGNRGFSSYSHDVRFGTTIFCSDCVQREYMPNQPLTCTSSSNYCGEGNGADDTDHKGCHCCAGQYKFENGDYGGYDWDDWDCASYGSGTFNSADNHQRYSCESCEVGKFQTEFGARSCNPCAVGSSQNSIGSTSCAPCRAGTYTGLTGSVNCLACDAGKYSTITGAISSEVCTLCLIGKYSTAGSSTCISCAAGKYSTDVVAVSEAACSACPGNTFSPEGSYDISSCQCNSGYTGTSSCTACLAGFYKSSRGSSSCLACALNQVSTVGASSCSCIAGFHLSAAGPESITYESSDPVRCVPCVSGKYLPTIGAASDTECIVCPSNSDSEPGSSSCQCIAGYTGSACIACVAGKYKTVSGSGACTDCGTGKYSTSTGAVSESRFLGTPC
jgi:hypothetical protein